MGALLRIEGGYNNFDPLRDVFVGNQLPTDQIPEVQTRCESFWKEALNLCLRYADLQALELFSDLYGIQTPPILYGSQDKGPREISSEGTIVLRSVLADKGNLTAENSGIDFDRTMVGLFYQLDGQDMPEQCLMVLGKEQIWYNTEAGYRAGGHGDLNYLGMVVGKIKDAAFPKDPNEKLEQQLDRGLSKRVQERAKHMLE